MRKSLLVLLIILFVAPILASCAPYWYGYAPYGYGGYYDPGYYGDGDGGTTVRITHTPGTGDTTVHITDTGGTTVHIVHITDTPDTGDTAEALGALLPLLPNPGGCPAGSGKLPPYAHRFAPRCDGIQSEDVWTGGVLP